ncbi:MAG: penicillin-binding protein 1A, partial [Beijerinckiaceae bacterium]
RKIREALLSFRIEAAYSKDKILELYLNEIYLGLGAYGVAAAALSYYGKSVHELTISEAAYLAALPKAPSTLNPFRNRERAIERRSYVLDRMVDDGHITAEEGEKAKKEPLGVNPRQLSPNAMVAGYFAEDVRRELLERYGEKKLYEGGLSVRTTLDPKLQLLARKVLADGLVRFDEARGFRGPMRVIDIGTDWGKALAEVPALGDVKPWQLAVVLEASGRDATIGLQPSRDRSGAVARERITGTLGPEGIRWTRRSRAGDILRPGDVIYVEPLKSAGQYRLRQIPEISGGLVAMDPFTGRVQAMVGGFSYDQSEFNRASQAYRQPGSSFKPIVYATALDNGYTPASVVLDEPITINLGNGESWSPSNYGGKPTGPHTLRHGIEFSKNLMTVRLARDVGMPLIAEYAKRFGVYDNMLPVLSMSLGAGETTILRMVTAYSMMANGGRRIRSTLIDRIQDRWGKTIFRHDQRACRGCDAEKWDNQNEPVLIDRREQVLDPLTAYQITSMMQGVVDRGTATVIKRMVGKTMAGKTGTTNDAKDLWFVGFSPNLVTGVYIGFDRPRSLGAKATGGHYAAPIVGAFMKEALKGQPDVPFRVPPGIKLISINAKTGLRARGGGSIFEAFKPGTAPPDSYSVVGAEGGRSAPARVTISPSQDRRIGSGTGGLY